MAGELTPSEVTQHRWVLDKHGPGKHGMTEGNPAAVPPVLPSILHTETLDTLNRESLEFISAFGLVPDRNDKGQMAKALMAALNRARFDFRPALTLATSPGASPYVGCSYGPYSFAFVREAIDHAAGGGKVVHSSDLGVSWSTFDAPVDTNEIQGVVVERPSGGILVASYGNGPSGTSRVVTLSSPGVGSSIYHESSSLSSHDPIVCAAPCWTNNLTVAVHQYSPSPATHYRIVKVDAANTSSHVTLEPPAGSSDPGNLAISSGVWIVCHGGVYRRSTTAGSSWTDIAHVDASANLANKIYGNHSFNGVNTFLQKVGATKVVKSINGGLTWTSHTLAFDPGRLLGFAAGKWVAQGGYTSTDGITWEAFAMPFTPVAMAVRNKPADIGRVMMLDANLRLWHSGLAFV